MKKLISMMVIFLISFASVFADSFDEGEKFYLNNDPVQAIPLLKKSLSEVRNPLAYVYLSICYYQNGEFQNSIDICNTGMKVSGTDKKVLCVNAGNSAFAMEDYNLAEQWYSKAMTADPEFAEPVLNRANARLNRKVYKSAREDYIRYLELAPQDVQRTQIEILIKLLDEQIVQDEYEEQMRLAEEQRIREEEERIRQEEERLAALKAEQERIEAEQRAEAERIALEEKARREKELLDQIASQLQNGDVENMTAGAEGTMDYGYETELE